MDTIIIGACGFLWSMHLWAMVWKAISWHFKFYPRKDHFVCCSNGSVTWVSPQQMLSVTKHAYICMSQAPKHAVNEGCLASSVLDSQSQAPPSSKLQVQYGPRLTNKSQSQSTYSVMSPMSANGLLWQNNACEREIKSRGQTKGNEPVVMTTALRMILMHHL